MPRDASSASSAVMTLEVGRPIAEHARRIMAWRNDPHARAMFYHHEHKIWSSFWSEYQAQYFDVPDLPPLFLLADGEPVAFLRYQPVAHPQASGGRAVAVSINVAPVHRGKGFAVEALRLGSSFVAREAGVDVVVAEVRTENVASQRAFVRAGYERLDSTTRLIEDTGECCAIVRFLHNLTPSPSRSRE